MASSSATLPPHVVTLSDLKHIRRELEAVDEFLHQSTLRTGGKTVKLPVVSSGLESLVSDNKLNLLKTTDRERLRKYLITLIAQAPIIHMSFASEPSGAVLGKLVAWMRMNIHPQVVISVGLQPSITAGCVVRTANKQFDFSMRASFERQRELLVKALHEEQPA